MKKFLAAFFQVLAYAASVVFIMLVLMAGVKAAGLDWEGGPASTKVLGDGLFLVAGIAVVNGLLTRFSRSRSTWAGWPAVRTAVRWFGVCGLLGMVTAAAMLLITLACGGGRITLTSGGVDAYLNSVAPLLGCLLISALGEEWFFRGYPLTRLAQLLGPFWANMFMALLFAVAHVNSEGWSTLVGANIVAGSLLVGTLRFTPGGIPAAWGFHFAWNSIQVVAGATVSGETFGVTGVLFSGQGPTWLSGGALGPEGGVGATIATGFVLLILATHAHRRGFFKKYRP
jgi:membrane protease YdiL (CAAX protease family)